MKAELVFGGLTCLLAVMLSAFAGEPELDTVVNGDFEGEVSDGGQAFGWKPFPRNFRVERNAGENGSTGLVYRNDDPKYYAFPVQGIRLVPGATYEITARYMTERLFSPSGAAGEVGLCVECKDANGKFTKGIYQSGYGATEGKWKGIYQIGTVPENAKTMTISPFVSPGFVGEVHFDAINVMRVIRKPVIGLYVSAYREQVTDGPVDLIAGLDLKAAQVRKEDFIPTFVLPLADGGRREVVATNCTDRCARITIDAGSLPMGCRTVAFELRDRKDGKVQDGNRAVRTVERLGRLPDLKVRFDRLNRLIVDGKPFFPLGMYWCEKPTDEELDRYAAGPFNCLMNYIQPTKADMDAYHRRGLKVIYTIEGVYGAGQRFTNEESIVRWTRNAVLGHKDHPALLAWYPNDERGQKYIPQLARRQALVRELDPDHPTWSVLYQLQILDKYMDTYDAIGTDPYPVGSDDDYAKCAKWAEAAVRGSFGLRPVWQVPQTFDWGYYWKAKNATTRYPSVREMKNMFWQAIACGANGLIGYSYHTLKAMDWKTPRERTWADTCAAAEEIRRFVPVLLADGEPPSVSCGNAAVRVRAWKDGETAYVLAVNTGKRREKVAVSVSGKWSSATAELGPMPVRGENGVWTLELSELDAALWKLNRQ